ncbi:MAG TPA: sulfatase/phosphatase domain-containing protein [Elusimicrobiota bacterium]|nr:sulfatase/phosphatase domain-containing protein [Elusimicrobiota bacterium]
MALALLLAAALAAQAAAAAPARLNLVFVDAAALSPDQVEPAFGFLASSAAVFETAIAQADRPAPSLASILTSEYAAAHGALAPGRSLSTGTPTLPELLARAGYRTALFSAGAPPAPGLDGDFKQAAAAAGWLAGGREPFCLFLRAGGASDAAAVREVWEAVERAGLGPRTAVILVAENGGRGRRLLDDGALRVPLVVRAPGVRPRKLARVVSAIDAAPTALGLLGLPVPAEFEGTDRAALLVATAPAPGGDGIAFSASVAGGQNPEIAAYAAREADWKLVYDKGAGTFRLYHLSADPEEDADAGAANPGRALDMTQKLLRHVRETGSGPERARRVSPDVLRQLREKGYW